MSKIEVGQPIYRVHSAIVRDGAFDVYEETVTSVGPKTITAIGKYSASTYKKAEMGRPSRLGYVWHTDPTEAKRAVLLHMQQERESLASKINKASDQIGRMIEDIKATTQEPTHAD